MSYDLKLLKQHIFFVLILLSLLTFSQKSFVNQSPKSGFVASGDVFGTRVFIENKGQFKLLPSGEVVKFLYEHGGEKIYFTSKGLVYEQQKAETLSEEEREAAEKGGAPLPVKTPKLYYVNMNWLNVNSNIELVADQKQSHYFTYGSEDLNAPTYKKLVYKNVYPNIDIEYTIPEDKTYGIKYTLILHPGANAKDVKIQYSGDVSRIKQLSNGDIQIKTPVEDIIEHAPISFDETKQVINSSFNLDNHLIQFNFPNDYNHSKTLFVDPWVTAVSGMPGNQYAFDVDHDLSGNTFIYGGGNSPSNFKVSKYNATGTLQWTFSGVLTTPNWQTLVSWVSGIGVEKTSGKTYVASRAAAGGVVRLTAAGNYDNFLSAGTQMTIEVGDVEFNCNGNLLVFGGAFVSPGSSGASAEIVDVVTGSVTAYSNFQPATNSCCLDIVDGTVDMLGNIFVLYGSGNAQSPVGNKIARVANSFTTTVWTMFSNYTAFGEIGNPGNLGGGSGVTGTKFNSLDVNLNYLYYYNGFNIAAFDRTTGTLVATTSNSLTVKQQAGIAVDDCDNVYVGGGGTILCYHFNGTSFSTLTPIALNASVTNQYVFDLQLDKVTKTLYVAGSGFVGTYSAVNSLSCSAIVNNCACIQPFVSVTTTSTNCVNVGTSTANIAGMPGPYTYSWMPGGQTTSVVTGLNPGSYTVAVTSTSCNATASAVTVFTSALPPYVLNVNSTSITCANLGSATVGLTGMPGPFSYTWLPTSQASSVATGLSPGTYTLNIYSFGCNLTFSTTTAFTSLIPLTGSINISNSITCFGASTGTGNVTNLAGGSGSQSYLWLNPANVSYSTSSVSNLSSGIWSVTVTDLLTGCQIAQSYYIPQAPAMNLLLSANTPTNCAGTNIVLTGTNSGGTPALLGADYTYTWTGGPSVPTNTVSQGLAGTYVYTLSSRDSLNCLTSNTIGVDFIQNPVLSVSNVSICPLTVGTLTALGASSYNWASTSLSLTGVTFTASPLVNTQYTLIGSALGCTSVAYPFIILKPLPNPVFTSNSPVCNGQNLLLHGAGGVAFDFSGPLSFTSSSANPVISPAAPSNSGVYQLTVTAANSCTASTTATLTVNPTPTLSATGSTICVLQTISLTASSFAGSNFVWQGPQSFVSLQQNPTIPSALVPNSGTYSVKVTSPVGCTNTAIANVTVTAMPSPSISSNSPRCFGENLNISGSGGVLYNWSGPNFFSSNLQSTVINAATTLASGMYSLTVNVGPCVATTSKSLTVYPLPVPTASNNGPLCENKILKLSAGGTGLGYYWQGPLGFTSYTQTPLPIDSVKLNRSGTYSLTVTDSHGCSNFTTTNVTIMTNPKVSASGATVCLNSPAILTASGAATYYWTGPNNYASTQQNANIVKAGNVNPVYYLVVGTAANTCTDTAMARLQTISLPSPSITARPKTRLCLMEAITFEGFGGLNYNWISPNNLLYAGKTVSFVMMSLTYTGDYTLTVSDSTGCKNSAIISLQVDDLPYGTLRDTASQRCVPFKTVFNFIPSSQNSTNMQSTWQLDGHVFSSKTFSYNFTTAGTYSITGLLWDTLSNCKNSINIWVDAYPQPKADFKFLPEKPVENTDEIIFTNTSNGENQTEWTWYFADHSATKLKGQTARYLFKEAGNYPVVLVVKNGWGCSDTTIKSMRIEEDFNVFIPNAFTPNGDELNDVFVPVLRGVKFYALSVFDRWGTLLFETAELNKGWDGTYKGVASKQDVYVWKMSVSSKSGEQKNLTGQVTLTR